jgi:hypothetical protein
MAIEHVADDFVSDPTGVALPRHIFVGGLLAL